MGFSPSVYMCPGGHVDGAGGDAREMVLLVEDDETIANLVSHILTRVGLNVIRARDGAGCVSLVEAHGVRIALVILDCRLPDMDGAVLCRELRATLPNVPVLLTSGKNRERAMIEQVGANAFLPKPFRPADVEREVKALMGAGA